MAQTNVTCACSKIDLSTETHAFLEKTNYDCLCNNCLIAIEILIKKASQYSFPKSSNEMIEGIHYYIENGYFVFTEMYHVLRGNCCQSGCRHCAYGIKN